MAITLKTDRQGLALIDQARIHKNWTATATAWCCAANVSLSTLKRFRERKAIQKDAFIAICQAVGIEDWQRIVAGSNSRGLQLKRRYRQSKRLIAEEVLSNLKTLDAQVDFIAEVFESGSAEDAIALRRAIVANNPSTAGDGELLETPCDSGTTAQMPLQLVANVSIIQIMMEV